MTKSNISYIVNKMKSANLDKYLCVVDDNNRSYLVKSNAQCGFFDDSNEVFVCLSKNDNPIRGTMNEGNFMIDFVDYDHITRIYLKASDKDILSLYKEFDFDTDDVKAVFKKSIASHAPSGFSYVYDKEGNAKQVDSPTPDLELGVPIPTPNVHPVSTESEEGSEG